MSSSIEQIKAPIKEELAFFEKEFRASMKTQVPLLDTIMTYIVKRKGKQIRPIFVLYSANLFGNINDRTYRGASLVELLHTATLVHDDVVDESYQRRSFFSINALWKNKIAVLVGDFLLSKGLLLSIKNKDHDLLEIVSTAVQEMSEGELLQLERARFMSATEDDYFNIIRKKTASLIASCCQIGAASTSNDPQHIEQMRLFG
jgi:octaprenyl-diphosphate synthase